MMCSSISCCLFSSALLIISLHVKKLSANLSFVIFFPFKRILSVGSIKCGELKNPVRNPRLLKILSVNAHVDPFPFVPEIWIVGNFFKSIPFYFVKNKITRFRINVNSLTNIIAYSFILSRYSFSSSLFEPIWRGFRPWNRSSFALAKFLTPCIFVVLTAILLKFGLL